MKKSYKTIITLFSLSVLTATIFLQVGCDNKPATVAMTNDQMIERGRYIVKSTVCADCHSPKIITPTALLEDSTKALSGHPAGSMLPPIDTNAIHPGHWYSGSPDLTAWIGPWGISYAANLTPDSTTGIGAWTDEAFIGTMRTGKHLGLKGGRPVLPPMPWMYFAHFTDDDLKSVLAYLKSRPAIRNLVPPPGSPADVIAMAKAQHSK